MQVYSAITGLVPVIPAKDVRPSSEMTGTRPVMTLSVGRSQRPGTSESYP